MSKTLALALVLVLLTTSNLIVTTPVSGATESENTWVEKAPMQQARRGLGVIAVDEKIYAIGGTGSIGFISSVLSTNEQYDPATNTWVYKASMPTARVYFAFAAYENKIYCFGGITGMGISETIMPGMYTDIDSYAVEVYDTLTDTWTVKTHMPKGGGMHMSAQEVNGLIYVFDSQNYVYVYNPINDSWAEKDSMSIPPYTTVIEGKIIATGTHGVRTNSTYYSLAEEVQQVATYDPMTNNLTQGSDASIGVDAGNVGATSGIYAPQRVYVMGIKSSTSPSIPVNQAYDPITNTWTEATPMPTVRTDFGVTIANDTLYAIGGLLVSYSYDSTGKYIQSSRATPTNINEQYIPLGYGTLQPTTSPTPNVPELQTWTIPLLLSLMLATAGLLVYHKKHKQ
jgi:N-acetylneuraminic acid mutarotase